MSLQALERALNDIIEDAMKDNIDNILGDSRELENLITQSVDSAIGDADNLVTQDELRGVEGEIENLQGRIEDLETVSTEEVAKEIAVERERIDDLERRIAGLEQDNKALRNAALALMAVMTRLAAVPSASDS